MDIAISPPSPPNPTRKAGTATTSDTDRAAQILQDLPALWGHPGVTDHQRRDLTRDVFEEVRVRERELVSIKPRIQYLPLFAYSLMQTSIASGKRLS